jgi:hypothetical protein
MTKEVLFWKTILIDVEPQAKSIQVGVKEGTTIGDIIESILDSQNQGADNEIGMWAKRKVGDNYDFILIRKSIGNAEVGYGTTFEELSPGIQEGERFLLDVRPYVG